MGTRPSQPRDRAQEPKRSLIPLVDEISFSQKMNVSPDFQRQFMLLGNFLKQTYTGSSNLTNKDNAYEVLRVFQMHPWDFSWQPLLSGNPIEIANDIHMAVKRAIFRVPLFDFVKCGLGYVHRARSIGAILDVACTLRDSLRGNFESSPGTMDTYIEVEKLLSQQDNRLAHWIVASSVSQTTDAPYDALALDLPPMPKIFTTKRDCVLQWLDDLDQEFPFINQEYDWNKFSTDLGFWKDVQQTLWSGNLSLPHDYAVSYKPAKDRRVSSKAVSFFKRLRVILRWERSSKRTQDIEEHL